MGGEYAFDFSATLIRIQKIPTILSHGASTHYMSFIVPETGNHGSEDGI